MTYDEFIVLSWRIYEIAVITAEIFGWASLIIGGIGFLMSKTNPARHRRFRGLLLGGAAALVSVLIVGSVYEAVTYIMTDQTGGVNHITIMYPDYFLTAFSSDMNEILLLAGLLSQVSAIIGMAAFVFGVGLWGIAKRRSIFNRKSKRIVYAGITLMMVSVGERLLAAGAHILITYIAAA